MKLRATHTAKADPARCFVALSDFDGLMQMGDSGQMRFERLDAPAPIRLGSQWQGAIDALGLRQNVLFEVTDLRPPEGYQLRGTADSVAADVTLSFAPEGPDQTCVTAQIALRPTTFGGRLLLKPLQLMQSRLQERLESRLKKMLAAVEGA